MHFLWKCPVDGLEGVGFASVVRVRGDRGEWCIVSVGVPGYPPPLGVIMAAPRVLSSGLAATTKVRS